MSVVITEQLSKTYQSGAIEVRALHDLNLTIEAGEYLAIMGASGSGKSTLLNVLGCMDKPTGGQYLLDGQDVSELDDDRLSSIRGSRIGFIFQSYNLLAQLNVIENIEVPMFYHGIAEGQSYQRARQLAKMVGLGDRLEHRPSQLSGGQQQRVAIARALANDPLIILADEPTGNLDSKSGAEILDILDQLHQKGTILVVVTHDEQIAERTNRVIHLSDGRIEHEHRNGRTWKQDTD